ncbi:MAG TPA: glycosyltransferase family 39 protein [Pyrinomonadaceae bacterium]|nr:glycosyltransferase family 39 protein [Pyrinomonadaceae bacterium]
MRRDVEHEGAGAAHDSLGQKFWAAWRWWTGPALAALALALLYADPFIGDWDALDYTLISIEGKPSSMALGRSLFIYTNHAAWSVAHSLFGLKAENAYLLFKSMVIIQSPLAAAACWALAREVTGSLHAATAAALLVVTSPFFVIYSGQVMTEIPSLLLTALALLVYLRGVRSRRLWLMLAGAVILGAGVNVRETVAFYALWLVAAPVACGWKLGRREITYCALSSVAFLAAAFGPFAYLFSTDEGYRAAWYGWREAMRVEEARHPLTVRNLLPFLAYFFLAAPLVAVALPVAAFKEWRARKFSATLASASVGFCATLLLLLNYSTSINWRYFLTGLPALAPLAADYFMREQTAKLKVTRRAFASTVAGVVLIAAVLGFYLKPSMDKFTAQHGAMKDYRARLARVPPGAVMLSGAQSIAVTYWRGVGLGTWDVIGAGSGWPAGRLGEVVGKYLDENRRVVVDADPRFWPPCGWQESETRELAGLEDRFRFRRLSDTLYEVRPLTDDTAHDSPNLKSLLPENRSAEVERCKGQAKLS